MIQSAIRQLQDTNTAVRREAVMTLGRIADPSALDALAEVVRGDPDPTVRDLARKAGQHIKAKNLVLKAKDQPATDAERERALAFLNQALDWDTRDNKARALEMLGRAFETDPSLRNDAMAANLARKLTSMSADSAVLLVADPVRRQAMIDMQTGGSGGADASEVGWGTAFFDLFIYWFANAALVFIGVTFLAQALVQAVAAFIPGTNSPMNAAELQEVVAISGMSGAALGLFYGMVYGVIAVIMLLILDVAIHLSATTIMGGEGTLAGLIHKTTLFYTVLIPVSIVIGMLPLLGLLDQRYVGILNFVYYGVMVLILVWSGKLIGDAYDFGTGKGCVSMLLGSISVAVAFFCCTFTLSMALANMANGM